jgi:hypothetical protein
MYRVVGKSVQIAIAAVAALFMMTVSQEAKAGACGVGNFSWINKQVCKSPKKIGRSVRVRVKPSKKSMIIWHPKPRHCGAKCMARKHTGNFYANTRAGRRAARKARRAERRANRHTGGFAHKSKKQRRAERYAKYLAEHHTGGFVGAKKSMARGHTGGMSASTTSAAASSSASAPGH